MKSALTLYRRARQPDLFELTAKIDDAAPERIVLSERACEQLSSLLLELMPEITSLSREWE